MLRIAFPFLLVFLLLSACAPHRTARIAPLPLPTNFHNADGKVSAQTERWWLSFNDPQLNLLMEQLFTANLSLAQAHARLRQSESLTRQARAFNYPTLNLAGQTGGSSQPTTVGSRRGESSQLSVSASYEIDLFGRLSAQEKANLLREEASREDLQSLYISLSAQLADLYYLTIEQRAQLALADETIRSYADTLARVEERYRQGIAASVEIYQARQNLAAARANRLNFLQELKVSENAIAVLLGDYPGSMQLLQQAEIPAAPPRLPTGLPAELLQNRPDLRAGLARVAARDAEVAAAIADRFPSFSLNGAIGYSRSDLTGSLISGNFWNYLLSLSQPLFDAGRRKAEVELNRARLSEAAAAYQELVLHSVQEVEDALSGNLTATERIARLQERVEAASAAEKLELERYLNGLTDYLSVLTNQVFHFSAQSQLLAARRQLLSQRISLARALGGGWMLEAIDQHKAVLQGDSQP